MMSDHELAAIRKRCEEATPGPWELKRRGGNGSFYLAAGNNDYGSCGCCGFDDIATSIKDSSLPNPDGVFAAHAREDIPKLLAEIERLKQK